MYATFLRYLGLVLYRGTHDFHFVPYLPLPLEFIPKHHPYVFKNSKLDFYKRYLVHKKLINSFYLTNPSLSNIEVDKSLLLTIHVSFNIKRGFTSINQKHSFVLTKTFLIYKSQLKTKSMSDSDCIVIGISGVTCGGKTTLANRLRNLLVPVHLMHQDKYFYQDDNPHHVNCEGLNHNDYDILTSLNMKAMYDDVISTMNGENKAHTSKEDRCQGRFEITGKKFQILEGSVLNYKPVMELCYLRYYFILEYGECFSWRCLRVFDPPDVPRYFEACVWPRHIMYRREIEKENHVAFINGTRHN